MSSIIWTDNFTTNYFAADVYSQDILSPPTVAPHALTMEAEALWEDQRHALPIDFTRATVWANIASLDDTAASVAVGLRAPFIFSSVKRAATERPMLPSPGSIDGLDGGIGIGGAEGTTPVIQLTAHLAGTGADAPDFTREHITGGLVELVLTPDGKVSVSSPDGSILDYTLPSGMVGSWLGEAIYPFVGVAVGSGAPTVLDSWGYEIDFPTPPSTVVPGAGSSGALKR